MNKPKYKLETAFSKLQSKKGSKKSKATPRDNFVEELYAYISTLPQDPFPARPLAPILRHSYYTPDSQVYRSFQWFDDEETT